MMTFHKTCIRRLIAAASLMAVANAWATEFRSADIHPDCNIFHLDSFWVATLKSVIIPQPVHRTK